MNSLEAGWSRDIFMVVGVVLGILVGAVIVNLTGWHWSVKCLFGGVGVFLAMRAHRFWLRFTRP
jgi:hypothetical protein